MERNYSSYLYHDENDGVLIDCGEPLTRSWFSSGLDCNLFEGILLSHLHFDHIGGFPMLMQGLWLAGRKRDLTVWLPRDGIEPLRQLLTAGCLFEELLPFKLRYEPLRAGELIRLGGLTVTPFSNTHLQGFERAFAGKYRLEYASYSFELETGSARIVHSADIGAPEDLNPALDSPLDALVCELAHFKPDHLFLHLQGRPIRKCVFVHLDQQSWEQREQLREQACSRLPDAEIHFPRDGEEIALQP